MSSDNTEQQHENAGGAPDINIIEYIDEAVRRSMPQRKPNHGAPGMPQSISGPLPAPFMAPPDLDPGVIAHIAGDDPVIRTMLSGAEAAFRTAHEGLTHIDECWKRVDKDPTLTEKRKVLDVANYASKKQDAMTKAWDKAHADLAASTAEAERDLSAPIDSNGMGPLGQEIRQYARSLPKGELLKFINSAIQSKDTMTVRAMLGVQQTYLAGLLPAERTALTHQWNAANAPDLLKRVEAGRKALGLLEARGPLILTYVQKAFRSDWKTVKKLRDATEATASALAR